MTISDHARQLVNKFFRPLGNLHCMVAISQLWEHAKQCALVCVEEIIESESLEPQLKRHIINNVPPIRCQLEYWFKLSEEIKKL